VSWSGDSRRRAPALGRRATRRRALGVVGGLAAAGIVGGAGAQEGTPAASPTSGEWSFTDDAGKTLTLPKRPQRVAADLNAASALWDFGIRPVAVSGWTIATDASWGNVDRATPNITVSAETSEPNLEDLLEMSVDLFVTVFWGNTPENPYMWSFPDPAAYERTNAIVPVIAISATGMADKNMLRFAELAGRLGADLETPELVAAKDAYEKSAADFAKVAKEKADLTTLFVYADGEYEYVAYPPLWADLAMYQAMGLNIIVPDAPPGDFWEELSPEQASKYISDVIFHSTRAGVYGLKEMAAHPTYGQLPAVKAGQVYPWNQDFIQSNQGLAAAFETLLGPLREAKKVTA
jgi:iron complex transport system substrate-binding protein